MQEGLPTVANYHAGQFLISNFSSRAGFYAQLQATSFLNLSELFIGSRQSTFAVSFNLNYKRYAKEDFMVCYGLIVSK